MTTMLIQIFLHKIYYRLGWRRWASLLWHVTCHVGVTRLLLTRVRVPCRLVNPGFPLSALFVAFVIIIISRIFLEFFNHHNDHQFNSMLFTQA